MIKNGKFFVEPDDHGRDFKALFRHLAAAGAGRTVDNNDIPEGPWTPELLAEAISRIDANRSGIDLRTVQLWFQDNDKGISSDNIRWLARIFGCDDPIATSTWQRQLVAAQARLVANRRNARKATSAPSASGPEPPTPGSYNERSLRPSLAAITEALFNRSAQLELPGIVFAGGVVLGFASIMLNVHDFEHELQYGQTKQIGFLWAPNWTVITWFLMPLFVFVVGDLIRYWKTDGRTALQSELGEATTPHDLWTRKVQEFAGSYWAVFAVSLPVAFFLQWVFHYLMPLLGWSQSNQAMNWGLIAVQYPDVISVPAAIAFTFFAYLYLGVCIYLFFAGLLLVHTIVEDLHDFIGDQTTSSAQHIVRLCRDVQERVMLRVFRCAVVGIMIPTVIKIQQVYLASEAHSIAGWFASDLLRPWVGRGWLDTLTVDLSVSTHFTSILIVLTTSIVFFGGVLRVLTLRAAPSYEEPARPGFPTEGQSRDGVPLKPMVSVFILLIFNYLLVGAFPGFTILAALTFTVAAYGAFYPTFGYARRVGDQFHVS